MLKMPDRALDDRINEFLTALAGVESVDHLDMTKEQRDSSKADYFAEGRQIVIEVKSLETDTQPRVEEILRPHRSRPEFPDFYGGWTLDKILRYLPDRDEINKQVFTAVTESIEGLYRKANSQIRSTKKTFGVPNSKGLLILLNQHVEILSPDVIMHRIVRAANKRNRDKTFQFVEIQHVLFISEAHYKAAPDNMMGFLILNQSISNGPSFGFEEFLEKLVKKWCEFNKMPLFRIDNAGAIDDLNARSVSKYLGDQNPQVTRQEAWRRYYRWNPYFHRLDEKGMKWMFKTIMSELTPSVLKGATNDERRRGPFWMEVFAHFIEEVNRRGLDMKVFRPISKELGREIERHFKKRTPETD